jgi:DNA gyrase subunit A
MTDLQKNFNVNMLALVDGVDPQVLTLKSILEHYIKHREIVVVRRTEHDLKKALARAHILEGLKIALITSTRSSKPSRSQRPKKKLI